MKNSLLTNLAVAHAKAAIGMAPAHTKPAPTVKHLPQILKVQGVSDTQSDAVIPNKSTPVPALRDPQDPESEITPAQLKDTPKMPDSATEKDILSMLQDRVKRARQGQQHHHPNWFDSWSFSRASGGQYQHWNGETGRFDSDEISLNDPAYLQVGVTLPMFRHREYNAIKPLLNKTKAKALSSKPEATIAPLTPRDEDKQAARQARGVDGHINRLYNMQSMQAEAVDWAMCVHAACVKIYYDPKRKYMAPKFGPPGQDGQPTLVDVVDKDGGEIVVELLSPFEWLWDPKSKSFDKSPWIVHQQVVDLSYVQDRYPRGWRVEADSQSIDQSGVEARMAFITNDGSRSGGNVKKDAVLLIEMWERPSARFKNGRVITYANNILLHYTEALPDGVFPFFPLYYQKSLGSVAGENATASLIDSQIFTNRTMNRIEEHTYKSTMFILAPEGCEIDQDFAQATPDMRVNYYKVNPAAGDRPPQIQTTPNMNREFMDVLGIADNFRRDNIGIHDVSDGKPNAGDQSGVAISLLKEGDDTQLASFIENLKQWRCDITETIIKIAQKKYLEPRLLMVQDSVSMDKDAARTEVYDFKHLATGRVVVSPSSASVQSPLIRTQSIMDMAKAGMLQPQNLPGTIPLLGALGIEDSDKLTDDLTYWAQQWQSQQPNPAQIQQQQAQAAQQQAADAAHAALVMAETKAHTDIEVLQAKAAADAQTIQLKASLDYKMEQLKFNNRMQEIGESEAIRTHAQQQSLMFQGQIDLMLAQFNYLHPNLAVTADPTAAVSLEKKIGLEGAIPPPPKPATKTTGVSK